jgi:hypothetical protein
MPYGREPSGTAKGVAVFLLLAFLGLVIFFSVSGSFIDSSEAVRALETQGYSDVNVTESHWFAVVFRGCSNSDSAMFEATAANPAGKTVNVFVCIGWPFKGATVRSN